jgi:hypothetical protein
MTSRMNERNGSMTTDEASRRNFLRVAAAGAGGAAMVAASAGDALAYQGNMERALAQLQGALRSLRRATPDKGGHKAIAIGLIEQAMGRCKPASITPPSTLAIECRGIAAEHMALS